MLGTERTGKRETSKPGAPCISARGRFSHASPVLAVFLLCLVMSLSCGRETAPRVISIHGEALGTFYTITAVAPPDNVTDTQVRHAAEHTLDRINRRMSTYREDSELSRFNRHKESTPFLVSEETYVVFEMAQRVARESDGAFDITVGPLVNAWGFGPDVFESPPTAEAIEALRAQVGYHHLELHDNNHISKRHPHLYCDLSGIAKGYASDAVAKILESLDITRYMVEVGGEIRVAGLNSMNKRWALGIEKPSSSTRALHTVVHLDAGALATSGDYRNMYEIDGHWVSHTIDPHTGFPVQHSLASVSVIHPSCAMADGYATALMVLGPDAANTFAREHDLAVLLIMHDGEADSFVSVHTPLFEQYLTP